MLTRPWLHNTELPTRVDGILPCLWLLDPVCWVWALGFAEPQGLPCFSNLDPQYLTFKLFGLYSLVGIGKFHLLFLWLVGVRQAQTKTLNQGLFTGKGLG